MTSHRTSYPRLKDLSLRCISKFTLHKLKFHTIKGLSERIIRLIVNNLRLMHYFELQGMVKYNHLDIKGKRQMELLKRLEESFIKDKWKGVMNKNKTLQLIWREKIGDLMLFLSKQPKKYCWNGIQDYFLKAFNFLFHKEWPDRGLLDLKIQEDVMDLDSEDMGLYLTYIILSINYIKLNIKDLSDNPIVNYSELFKFEKMEYHHIILKESYKEYLKKIAKEGRITSSLCYPKSVGFLFCHLDFVEKEIGYYLRALILGHETIFTGNQMHLDYFNPFSIDEFVLASTFVNYETCCIINDILSNCKLQKLVLDHQKLDDTNFKVLLSRFEGDLHLNELTMDTMSLTEEMGKVIQNILSNDNCKITKLTFTGSYFLEEFINHLKVGLLNNKSLKHLCLKLVGNEDITKEEMVKFVESLSKHQSIEELDFNGFEINLKWLPTIINNLTRMEMLTKLDLRGQYLATIPTLKELELLFQHKKLSSITLDFKGARFRDISHTFFKILRKSKNLKEIKISTSRIGDNDLDELLNLINSRIPTSLICLDLSNNAITGKGAVLLNQALRLGYHKNLRIDLSGNPINLDIIKQIGYISPNLPYAYKNGSQIIFDESKNPQWFRIVSDGFDEF